MSGGGSLIRVQFISSPQKDQHLVDTFFCQHCVWLRMLSAELELYKKKGCEHILTITILSWIDGTLSVFSLRLFCLLSRLFHMSSHRLFPALQLAACFCINLNIGRDSKDYKQTGSTILGINVEKLSQLHYMTLSKVSTKTTLKQTQREISLPQLSSQPWLKVLLGQVFLIG